MAQAAGPAPGFLHPLPGRGFLPFLSVALLLSPLLAGCLWTPEAASTDGVASPLLDPRVRTAIAIALDAPLLRETAYDGALEGTFGLAAHPLLPGAAPELASPDVERARALLNASGHLPGPEGERFGGVPLRLVVPSSRPDLLQVADRVARDLAPLGIRVDTYRLPWGDAIAHVLGTRQWDLAVLDWAPAFADADAAWSPLATRATDALNTGVSNPELEAHLAAARAAGSEAARLASHTAAERERANGPHLIPLGAPRVLLAHRDRVAPPNPLSPFHEAPGPYVDLAVADPETPVRHAVAALPPTLDPARANDAASRLVAQNVYEPLLRLAGEDAPVPEPHLAERWSRSADGLEYRFTLREGIRFENGNPLTAEDAAFTIRRLLRIPDGPLSALGDHLKETGVATEGDRTLVLHLTEPWAALPALLASPAAGILDAETCAAHGGLPVLTLEGRETDPGCGAWLATNAMGTGPYRLTAVEADRIVLTARDTATAPFPDRAPREVHLVPTPSDGLVGGLLTGALDLAEVAPADAALLRGTAGVRLQTAAGLRVVLLAFQLQPAAGSPKALFEPGE